MNNMVFGKGKQQKAWNKGLTKETDERIAKYGKTQSKIKNSKDWKQTKGIIMKKKLSDSSKKAYKNGRINPMKGKKRPDLAEYNRTIKKGQKRLTPDPKKGKTWEEFYGEEKAQKIKNKLNRKGEKNSNWRGGISNGEYGFEFNKELKYCIKLRDENICQHCDSEENLVVHHIDYDKKNNNPKNLITMCNKCHGKTNGNRIHFTKFFISYQKKKECTINYGEFELRCRKMAKDILKLKDIKTIYGIPNGGIIIATRVSYLTGIPITFAPNQHTIVIDDIVDSGMTKHSFGQFRYFFALVNKDEEDIQEWVRFWWEDDQKNSD